MRSETNNSIDYIDNFDYSNSTVCIVKSVYHNDITDKIYQQSIDLLREKGLTKIYEIKVAGAFELIYGCSKAINMISHLDGIIAIGCVIKGATDHDVYINNAICDNLGYLQAKHNVPIGLGLLTVNNKEQALERVDGSKGQKGIEATEAILNSIGFKLNTIE